jgi:hypothetical protein
MNTKSISRICGVLYIVTVLAFLIGNLVLKEPLVDAENVTSTLERVGDNEFQYRLGVAIDSLQIVAVMALVFSLFTILKPINSYLALLALGWRIGEVVLQAGAKIPDYLLLTLSKSSGSGSVELENLAQMLIDGSTWAVGLSFVFLSIGSIFNNYLFYKGKAIPAGLAIFGLIATALYTLASVLPLFVDLPDSALVLMLPLVLFELLLGFYLAVYGMKAEMA